VSVSTNLLPANTSSIETDTTGWTAGANTSLDKASRFYQGASSLGLTATATGTVSATTAARVAVEAGTEYQAYAFFANRSAAASGRSATVRVDWYAAASGGTAISSVTSAGGTLPNSTTFLTPPPGLIATAPAGAAWASVTVSVTNVGAGAAAGVVVDLVSLGPPTTWNDNLIGYGPASVEVDATGWSATSGLTLSRSSANQWEGWYSLVLTSTAAVEGVASLATAINVTPGTEYTSVAIVNATVSGSFRLGMRWYDSLGAEISTDVTPTWSLTASTWTRVTINAVAPPGAATARLLLRPVATASGQTWLCDQMGILVAPQIIGNMLTYQESSVEGGVQGGTDWAATSGCTVARSMVRAWAGVSSLAITPDGSGDAVVSLVRRLPVTPRQAYRLVPYIYHAATTASVVVDLVFDWYDAGGELIRSGYFRWLTATTAGWYALTGSGVAPDGAATVAMSVRVRSPELAAGALYMDNVVAGPGGLAAIADPIAGTYGARVSLQGLTTNGHTHWSLHRMLADGSMTPVRGSSGDLTAELISGDLAVVEDHEAPLGATLTYRVRVYTPPAGSGMSYSASPIALPEPAPTHVVLKDPLVPARWAAVVVGTAPDWQRPARQVVHQVQGRELPVVISDVRGGRTGTLTLVTATRSEHERILWLLRSGNPVLIQWPTGWDEDDMYVSVGDLPAKRLVPLATYSDRSWELPLTEVERPIGGTVGSSDRTWQTIASEHDDWLEALQTYGTWLGVLTGVDA
jgi:hypothetical protein